MTGPGKWKVILSVFSVCMTLTGAAVGQTFTTLVNFDGANGEAPWYASLVQGRDGRLYGTASLGGGGCPPLGCGTAFRMEADNSLSGFGLSPGKGTEPLAGLLLASDGNFYGTAYQEGANGGGTIFVATEDHSLSLLYSFCVRQDCTDGELPQGALIQGTDGNLYGTTAQGGFEGDGTIFTITAEGALKTLHRFNGNDGASPIGGLLQASDGNFYGTTSAGGSGNGGTVFRLTPGGSLKTLQAFSTRALPLGRLVEASDGAIYGTTSQGGANGDGTVFKVTESGVVTTLYDFCSQPGCSDGEYPEAGLTQATDGNLYGTTFRGGSTGQGTIFMITLGGVLTTLHSFDPSEGNQPFAGLLQATDGNFYGTTNYGGDFSCNPPAGCGTIFRLDMGLDPFVTFVRAAGRVGQTGGILGQGFTGTTSVMLNGVAANFTVVSDTYIKATVPPGATTGFVTVTTPTGVLTSNVPFRVIQ